jgi:hypothetical protein
MGTGSWIMEKVRAQLKTVDCSLPSGRNGLRPSLMSARSGPAVRPPSHLPDYASWCINCPSPIMLTPDSGVIHSREWVTDVNILRGSSSLPRDLLFAPRICRNSGSQVRRDIVSFFDCAVLGLLLCAGFRVRWTQFHLKTSP